VKIKRTKITILLLSLIVSVCIFVSCRKNQPSWNTQILAPIVNANLSINDLVTSNYIKSNPADSSVSLVYTDSLYSLNLVTIPDTTLDYNYFSPITTKIDSGHTIIPSLPTTTKYATGTAELKKAIIQSGSLNVHITNSLSQMADYFYTVPNATLNGNPLRVFLRVPANTKDSIQVPMAGYTVDFTGPTHNSYNEVTTNLQIDLDSSANSLIINQFDNVGDAQVTFSNIVPYYAKGYFGTDTSSYAASNLAFPVFNRVIAGSLNLQNVTVKLALTNNVGVDASLIFTQLSSYNSRTNSTQNLFAPGILNSTININRAVETHNPASPVIPTVTTFTISPSNSNILAWLDNLPTNVGYAFHIKTDPLGNVSGDNDFAYSGYGINSTINVVIPLSLIATNLTLADTLAINFGGSGSATQQVKSGKLTIYASNGFPFSAGLQMYLLNQNNAVVDSIFIPTQTIAAGNVNAISGKVTSPQNSVLTISLDAFHTQELFNTKTAILYARFNMGTAPSTYREIYNYYQLGLKMVGNFNYQVN
jgi:hypothetical protein